ncbi:MAG: hypothetical protein AB7D33_01410 [Sphingobium sp.]
MRKTMRLPLSALARPALTALCVTGGLLAGCDDGQKNRGPSSFDISLANGTADPAPREAIEAPAASGPDRTDEADRDARAPSDQPLNGTLPLPPPRLAKEQARKLAGGALISAPAVTKTITSTKVPVTLDGIAAQKTGGGKCSTARVDYAMQWAQRLPREFPLYPGANVIEAAGTDEGPCLLRAVSFIIGGAQKDVMDFYASMAKRAGYSVEHEEENSRHALNGMRPRDGSSYYIGFSPVEGSRVMVDLVANPAR